MDIAFDDIQFSEREKKSEKQNQKEPSYNFERLFSELVEVQSDIESLDDGVQKFFSQYIDNIINPNEIKNTTKIIKQNSSIQDKIKDNFKLLLEMDLKENREKVEKGIKITKQIETKTYQVARAKDMFRELNEMIHGDIISHQKEIKRISDDVQKIQQQITEYEKEIEELNEENKKSYSEELSLLDTVMSFSKKLYSTYATREEKKKEIANLEAQVQKLKDEIKIKDAKYQESIDTIAKNKDKQQKEFEENQKVIELFLNSYPGTSEEYDKIINSLKELLKKNLSKYNELQKAQKDPTNTKNNILSINDLKSHINLCNPSMLQELFNQVEFIRSIHPYLSIPLSVDTNNIIDVVEALSNQISNILMQETIPEKINMQNEKQLEDIENKIADHLYETYLKTITFKSLKKFTAEEKKKKQDKIQELKDKEEKLKQLQMKFSQISNLSNKSNKSNLSNISNNSNSNSNIISEITNISCNSPINEVVINDKEKDKNKKRDYSFEVSEKSSEEIIPKNNTINIKIKDKKKEEKRKNKISNINVILEEEDSKSNSKIPPKNKEGKKENNKIKNESKDKYDKFDKYEKDKDEKNEKYQRNESTEKKNKQKSFKKRGKSQIKKKKNHRKKKYEGDSDEECQNEDKVLNEIFGKGFDTQNNDKSPEKEKEKPKLAGNYYESDSRKNKNLFNFPKNNFNKYEDNKFGIDQSNPFDLNDLNFLTELGEELNKTDNNYGFGRKNNYRK